MMALVMAGSLQVAGGGFKRGMRLPSLFGELLDGSGLDVTVTDTNAIQVAPGKFYRVRAESTGHSR
jgi:hypothetical protein